MNGLLIIDKPRGMTSHDVVQRVRRIFRTKKVGHAGTLDPMATGVLQVAVGRATRILQFLMSGEKAYRAVLKFGEITDTQDAEGRILERRNIGDLSEELLVKACKSMEGDILQTPPMYSAVKRNGVPLYKLAREGIEVEREPRQVRIRRIHLQKIEFPFATIEIECSKGTYIRTLCHDIGLFLGPGAHLTELRRTRSGGFTEADAIALEDLERLDPKKDPMPVLSMEDSLRDMPSREVISPEGEAGLANGIPPELSATSGDTIDQGQVLSLKISGRLAAVARFDPTRDCGRRGDFELLRVFPQTT